MDESSPLPLTAVRRVRLSEEIVGQIERLILNHELPIGAALPSERQLAAQLGVSRNILREAVRTLVQKGLLEVRAGSGTYVARPGAEFLQDFLDLFVRTSEFGLLDLVEARRALEVQIAELAAQRATEDDCRLIDLYLDELETASADPEHYIEADVSFHAALGKAARNEILQQFLKSIRGAMRENIRIVVTHRPEAVQEALRAHRRIALAVRAHACAEARLAMDDHLQGIQRHLQDMQRPDPARDETAQRHEGEDQ
jgi:GntR family transcriptional repressor for pyruvate dehydrogenase complex